MISAGIDVGAISTKISIIKDGRIIIKNLLQIKEDPQVQIEQALKQMVREVGLNRSDLQQVYGVGTGREGIKALLDGEVNEIIADALGAVYLVPSARTVIDVGAEAARAILCDAEGKVRDFTMNDKCAAGAGTFVESMSRALEITLEEFGELSLQSKEKISINAQCAIFAESEVVSLVHENVAKADICRAVHEAMAGRVISMTRRAGMEPEIIFIGGMARDRGFVKALTDGLEIDVTIPPDPEYVGSIGAALLAAKELENGL